MKRLREIEASSPLIEKAQALIESVDPVPVSEERMLRVRRQLDQPQGVWIRARRLPALAMATLVIMFGASAFAAVRIYVAVVAVVAVVAERAPADAPAPLEPATRKPRRAARKLPTPDPAVVVEDAAEQVVPESVPVLEPATPRSGTEPRVRAKAQPKPRDSVAADSELVHRAVKALRRDGDPALAARLLDESRAHNPDSPLAEEALSLQIEAAVELGEPRAHRLAHEYIARYPSGRYLAVARRALEDAAP